MPAESHASGGDVPDRETLERRIMEDAILETYSCPDEMVFGPEILPTKKAILSDPDWRAWLKQTYSKPTRLERIYTLTVRGDIFLRLLAKHLQECHFKAGDRVKVTLERIDGKTAED